MQPDRSVPAPLLPRFVREHPWLTGYLAVLAPLAVWDVHRNGPWIALVWLSMAALLVGAEVLYARLGTRLDRATSAELIRVAVAHPNRTPLLDRETGDVLTVRFRRVLGFRSWLVQRCPDGRTVVGDVDDDFAAGRLSTIPITAFMISHRRIASLDDVIPVRQGEGGNPEAIPTERRGQVGDMLFRVRTGSIRVTPAEVEHLTAQLHRAEPIRPEPEEVSAGGTA